MEPPHDENPVGSRFIHVGSEREHLVVKACQPEIDEDRDRGLFGWLGI